MDTVAVERVLKDSMGFAVSSIGKVSLKNAIKKRMRALKHEHLYLYITCLKTSKQEVNNLIEEVAVNETWFLRDKYPFIAMVTFVKSWQALNPHAILRILSIPCSTGEEPYSLAISLLKAGIHKSSFIINAIDISGKAIKSAEKAIYGKNSFRGTDHIFRKHYFHKVKTGYSLNKNIKKLVRFFKGNLLDLNLFREGTSYHIIFCRNLLIYFDCATQKKAIDFLDTLLAANGILFIGHAEPGVFSGSQFVPAPYAKSFSMYRRDDLKTGSQLISKDFSPFQLKHSPGELVTKTLGKEPQLKTVKDDIFDIEAVVEARFHYENGEYDKAMRLCWEDLKLNGPAANTFFWLGKILYSKDDKDEAVIMLRKSVYLNPEHLEAMELLCRIFLQTGDTINYQSFLRRIQRVRSRLNNNGTKE